MMSVPETAKLQHVVDQRRRVGLGIHDDDIVADAGLDAGGIGEIGRMLAGQDDEAQACMFLDLRS